MGVANGLELDPDTLLSTTRAVRRRLDVDQPVEPNLIRECIELATQAPTGSNAQSWHFIVVTDASKRAAIGGWYRRAFESVYGDPERRLADLRDQEPAYVAATRRVIDSATHLAQHMAAVPVHVIPVMESRLEGASHVRQASAWGSLLPAVWSFCLAAKARGLGTCWTTLHLMYEQEVASLLGIPDSCSQASLIPVAHTVGTDFRPGPRRDLNKVIHTDGW
jgi:nitroreductase